MRVVSVDLAEAEAAGQTTSASASRKKKAPSRLMVPQ
jgi:hypothetical protein